MDANKIRVLFNNQPKDIVFPLEQVWDFGGAQEAIEQYETTIVDKILNKDDDFEVTRFDHAIYDQTKTSLNYEFYLNNPIDTTPTWLNSYIPKFSVNQIYYYQRKFSKSFWKIDYYDSPTTLTQKIYLTTILPVSQGYMTPAVLSNTTPVQIRRPKYTLDYIGDKEGFFIYWLKKRNFLNVDTFYMTAKFFNADNGTFIKMMNRQQNSSNPFDFPPEDYFYYKVKLDYPTQTFEVFNHPNGNRVGTVSAPIKWYEYVNPQ
jgi:hypothetical protein